MVTYRPLMVLVTAMITLLSPPLSFSDAPNKTIVSKVRAGKCYG